MANDCTIIGVDGAHPDLIPETAALAVRGELDLGAMTEVVPWADVPRAIERAGAGDDIAFIAAANLG